MSSRRRRGAEGFPFWRAAGSGIVVAGAIGVAFFFLRPDVETVDAEARYKGVHHCSPKYLATLTPTATLTATATPAATGTVSPAAAGTPTTASSPTAATAAGGAVGGDAGEVILYEEDFNDGEAQGWELEPNWRVVPEGDGRVLQGEGHRWARAVVAYDGEFRVRFRLKLLRGVVHLVYRLNDTGRYFIGFGEDGTYLEKQYWPDTFLEGLAEGATPHRLGSWYDIEIVGEGAVIRFVVDGQQELEYRDPEPLAGGSFAFETLDDSGALVDDVVVYGPTPSPAAGAPPVAGAVDTPMSTVASTVAPITTAAPPEPIRASLGGEGSSAPFFSQTSPRWGSQEYDHGFKQDVGCGSTIAQCGCAMTSVATVLDLFEVVTTAEGLELNPQTLNEWSNRDAQLTSDGWVSRGYAYGNVMWTDANAFSAEAARTQPGMPMVRYTGWGDGSEDEIRAELEAGRPVVLEVPGHFIAAVALDGDDILINDPYYRDRTTLAAYEGRVRSSRLFEASRELGGVLITVPANLRVRVTDSQGRVAGTLEGGAPDKVAKKAKEEIPGAVYRFEGAWRDPTCDEPPPTEEGVNQVFIPNPGKETFQVEVSNPEGGDTTVAVHTYDDAGNVNVETRDAHGNNSLDLDYDPKPGGKSKIRQPQQNWPGHFVDETIPRLPPEPGSGQDSAIGDVDGDGDLDIFVAGGRTIYDPRFPKAVFPPTGREPDRLLINDGRGVFRDEAALRLPKLIDPSTAVALGDFNGDGHLDVLMANDGEQSRLLINDGHGLFVDRSSVLLPPEKWRVRTVERADVDGDGDIDLLLATGERPAKGDSSAHLLIAGSPLKDESDRLPSIGDKVVNHLLPFDADGDGDQDVFVSVGGPDPEQPRLWINQGGGQFVDETKSRLPNVKVRAQKAVAGDMDGDGDLDVMVATAGGPVHLLINEGRGVFSNAALDRMPRASINAVDVELADSDRDRDLDALVTGSPGGLHLLANDGAGYFSDVTDDVFPPVLGTLASGSWGDVDGDGDLDIFAPRHNNKLNALLINVDLTPSPTAATPTPTPTPTETGAPTATPPPPGPSPTPGIPATPEIPPTPFPTSTPVPPPTSTPVPTPTPVPPTHTPRPTQTPCPDLQIGTFTIAPICRSMIACFLGATWSTVGGCSPISGTLNTPSGDYPVSGSSGSQAVAQPTHTHEGVNCYDYRLDVEDASGQTDSSTREYCVDYGPS